MASGQIPPYLQEGLGPWEPSEGQVEELLTLSLTRLKITFSINQTLHEASFNLQAPHLCIMILLVTVMATAEAIPAEKTALAIRREPADWESLLRSYGPLEGRDIRARVRKESVQWELCVITASKFSVS